MVAVVVVAVARVVFEGELSAVEEPKPVVVVAAAVEKLVVEAEH